MNGLTVSARQLGHRAGAPIKRSVRAAIAGAGARSPLGRVLCYRGNRSASTVALTFDDGPHPDYTAPVLDILADCGAVATFFVLGRQVDRHPHLLEAIRDAGHEIGIHGYDHTSRRLAAQARRTRSLCATTASRRTCFGRPAGVWAWPRARSSRPRGFAR